MYRGARECWKHFKKKLINFLVLKDLIELYNNFPFNAAQVEKIQKKSWRA